MKYNWNIIGHEKQLRIVERDLASGNLSHAYLFVGPNSVGKSTVAKKMAGILQCEADFCHRCNTCLQIEKSSHVDTVEMRGKDSIKIADIRSLIDRLSMTPQARYKVVLIQSIERMTSEAANSFLKILEEPPPQTVFLLTSNDLASVLPTIISRVRMIKFHCFSNQYLEEKMASLYPETAEKDIHQACVFALGKAGRAIHMLETPEDLAESIKLYHDVLNFLDHKNVFERFAYVEELIEEPKRVMVFLNILAHVLRSKILEASEKTQEYVKTLSKIDEAAILLGKNVNQRLLLENLMLAL